MNIGKKPLNELKTGLMSKSHTFFYVLIVFVTLSFSACSDVQKIELKHIDNIQLLKISDNKIDLSFDAELINPNKRKLKLSGLKLDLIINEKVIGTLLSKESIVLTANSENKLSIPVQMEVKDLMSGLTNVYMFIKKDQSIPEKVFIKGYVKGRSGMFPFRKKFEEKLKNFQKN